MTDMMNFPSANHDCKFKFSRPTIIYLQQKTHTLSSSTYEQEKVFRCAAPLIPTARDFFICLVNNLKYTFNGLSCYVLIC